MVRFLEGQVAPTWECGKRGTTGRGQRGVRIPGETEIGDALKDREKNASVIFAASLSFSRCAAGSPQLLI